MKHVDHIGIAVKSLATALPIFEKLLNTKCYKTEVVDVRKCNDGLFENRRNEN
jgi:methylmalonyl-CoA/ethylmalonyl-CoA epimerase